MGPRLMPLLAGSIGEFFEFLVAIVARRTQASGIPKSVTPGLWGSGGRWPDRVSPVLAAFFFGELGGPARKNESGLFSRKCAFDFGSEDRGEDSLTMLLLLLLLLLISGGRSKR